MKEIVLLERLLTLQNQKVQIETKGYHVGYLNYKGILIFVGEDYIEMECGNKGVIIPISEIRVITLR